MKEKETKSFFANNNRLNKGYGKSQNPRELSNVFYRKKFEHILPPIELLEEYENILPGTMDKVIKMAEKEQDHRHLIDIRNIEIQESTIKKSKIYALIFMGFVCVAVVFLTILGYFFTSCLLAILVFGTTGISAILSCDKIVKKKEFDKRHI